MTQAVGLADIGSVASGRAKASRPVYTFDVPEKLAAESETSSIAVVQLTAGEEMAASKRAQMEPIRLAYELAKEALRAVNGKPVSTADGTADAWWENPRNTKIRTLVVSAYNLVNAPSQDETAGFLKSCSVTVG